ncbi:MAG: hypothetical protein WCF33_12445 [Pseudonocardiaceae bacterium]
MVSPWWVVAGWAVVGAALGVTVRWPVRSLLSIPRRDYLLVGAAALGSATAMVFGLLAWRLGTPLELLAYSGLAAVCVPLALIDLLEQRMPARLLLPAYPTLVVLFGLAAVAGHHGTAMLRALAGMAFCSSSTCSSPSRPATRWTRPTFDSPECWDSRWPGEAGQHWLRERSSLCSMPVSPASR